MVSEGTGHGVILFYPVGLVHLHTNLALLADAMPGWKFRVIYEPNLPWFTKDRLVSYPHELVPFVKGRVPEGVWDSVRVVLLSTAQLRPPPFNLVWHATQRGVPTVAIQESLQFALNDGRVSNYVLPVDYLLVASEHERRGFIASGVPSGVVEVTGWPFYSGLTSDRSGGRRSELKSILGLQDGRPVATLSLAPLARWGSVMAETPMVRRELLTLASKGLPPDYQLLIKPHPGEATVSVKPFVDRYAPSAKVVDGRTKIAEVLEVTDVLLTRGNTQAVVEALLREIPVVAMPVGTHTPFSGVVDDVVISQSQDLGRVIGWLSKDGTTAFGPFFERYLPIQPQQALKHVARRITEIAGHGRSREPATSCWRWSCTRGGGSTERLR